MKIQRIRSEFTQDRARIVATVVWEDVQRPQQEVYFETDERFAQGLSPNPHAFLAGCILPAMHHGEKRIWLDAEVCPVLLEGLAHVTALMRHWFYAPQHPLIRIEARTGNGSSLTIPARAGCLFSGGVDSLALVWANRTLYPPGHPWSFKDALLILGQNIESDTSEQTWQQALAELTAVTADAGITLIPVYTNIRSLDNDTDFFLQVNQAAILASVAHAFAGKINVFSIASTHNMPALALDGNFMPYGSHPLVDAYYSSADLQLRHLLLPLSRLDRIRIVTEWNAGLQNIRVCGPNWPGTNCGKCEKCVRTMLELLVLGVLDKTTAFPFDDLTEDMVAGVRLKQHTLARPSYLELIPLLEEKGRHDLARAVHHVLTKSREKTDLKARLRRNLGKLRKRITPYPQALSAG